MAVKPLNKDKDGSVLDTNVTTLTTTVANLGNSPAKFAAQAALDQAQRELVLHYLNNGRITAASVLSTLS